MRPQLFLHLIAASLLVTCVATAEARSAEPGWTPRVLKVGEDRERTNALDITERPYRPLHFYGNTVRRRHYRGETLPSARDVTNTVRYIVVR